MSDPDHHAAERERRRRKARYGMQVTGRSVRLLGRLRAGTPPVRRKKGKKRKP